MKCGRIEGVCWFVVPMCISFGVGPVRGAAVLGVFRNDCWSSPSG